MEQILKAIPDIPKQAAVPSCDEILKMQVNAYNSSKGNLTGYDCEKCLNKGYISKISDGREVMTECEFPNVAKWFEEKFDGAWDKITGVFDGAKAYFSAVWEGIKGIFSHVTDWFRDKFTEAWEAVKYVFSNGGAIFDGIVDGIFNVFRDVVNSLIYGINCVIWEPFNAINAALDGIRGVEIMGFTPFEWLPYINIPQIPYLAQGTIVPANYGNFLAVLGDNKREAEVVSPISSIEKAVENVLARHGMPKEITVVTYLYPNSAAYHREIIKIVNDDNRRKGL